MTHVSLEITLVFKTISAPAEARINKKVTGMYIRDLVINAMMNLKKLMEFAEEYLNDGGLSSLTTWADLDATHFWASYSENQDTLDALDF